VQSVDSIKTATENTANRTAFNLIIVSICINSLACQEILTMLQLPRKDVGQECIINKRRKAMYAQLVLFTLGSGMRSQAEKIADEFNVAHKPLKGYKSAIFLGDDANGEYGSLTTWETPDDLKSATDILRPKLTSALSGISKGPPTIRIFDVYKPVT
jgi:hypothetical protein